MRLFGTFLAALLLAHPAFALSCLRPDVVRLYQDAKESDERFYFVKGILTADDLPDQTRIDGNQQREPIVTTARITGYLLGSEGFKAKFDRELTLQLTCLSIWCGNAPNEQKIFAAIKLTDQDLELAIGPCGFNAVEFSETDEDRLLRCHQSGDCG